MPQPYQLVAPLSGMTMQTVMRREDNAFIPFDGGNVDYQRYLSWLDEGNEPDPAPEPHAPAPEQQTEEPPA